MNKKTLLVIDMQNDFITGSLGTAEAQAIVPNVVQMIRSWNGTIYATQDTHFDDYLTTPEGIKLPVEHCLYSTNGWKIQEDVYTALLEHGYHAWGKKQFADIPLMHAICAETPSELHIMGLDTDICVVSNAIIARTLAPALPIIVHADCCAGSTPERHLAALEVMRNCQIDVV